MGMNRLREPLEKTEMEGLRSGMKMSIERKKERATRVSFEDFLLFPSTRPDRC